MLDRSTTTTQAEARNFSTPATTVTSSRTADGEELLEMIKSWEQRKAQAFDALYAATAKEQA